MFYLTDCYRYSSHLDKSNNSISQCKSRNKQKHCFRKLKWDKRECMKAAVKKAVTGFFTAATCPAVNIRNISRYTSTWEIETMLVSRYKHWISVIYTDNFFEPSWEWKSIFPNNSWSWFSNRCEPRTIPKRQLLCNHSVLSHVIVAREHT